MCKQVVGDSSHINVLGPSKTQSFGGTKYFVSFIDDFSHKSFIYILKNKKKFFPKFKKIQAFVKKTKLEKKSKF